MAKVHILNVNVNNNPATFFTPFQFEINFECLEDLQDDLEFKIIYVGSAETVEFDQTLDQIVVDAVPKGQYKFLFEADPPNIAKIPADDAVGVTVVLITANFKGQEFVRIGYYVNNEYDDPELKDSPPAEPNFSKLTRIIAADQPRVTKFKINWESQPATSVTAAADGAVASSSLPDADMVDESNNLLEKNGIEQQSNGNGLATSFENKENLNKSESNLFQLPINSQSQSQSQQQQQQFKFGTTTDKSFIINNNSNLLFENSIDSVMN